ncbi:MAG: ATP-binding cassette domain-containing protein, partial [Bacteroides sp.]|nr:ATP-binding cassette domain-containing protein [Bacteroides sp.]
IRNSKSTILVASHDRAMLNQLDITLELSDKGIEVYGGNYDFYKEQNQLKIDALQVQLAEQEKSIKQSLKQVQQLTELRQRRETRGRRHTEKAGLPRIIAGALASKAQQTTSRMKTQQESKIDELNRKLSNTQQQIKKIIPLRMKLKAPPIHRGKILVEATDINVFYRGKGLWAEPLNLKIISGDRIHLIGANGTGKTSLIKLIRSELEMSKGRLDIAPFSSFYIDQEYSLLNHSNILIEQLQEFNDRALLDHELKTLLHRHQFPVEAWNKQCRMLSGGEKMKLLLCCMGLRNSSPDVLLLDEPTNNIDVYSQEILTKAIRDFHGTLVVVSHDSYFIDQIHLNKKIELK